MGDVRHGETRQEGLYSHPSTQDGWILLAMILQAKGYAGREKKMARLVRPSRQRTWGPSDGKNVVHKEGRRKLHPQRVFKFDMGGTTPKPRVAHTCIALLAADNFRTKEKGLMSGTVREQQATMHLSLRTSVSSAEQLLAVSSMGVIIRNSGGSDSTVALRRKATAQYPPTRG